MGVGDIRHAIRSANLFLESLDTPSMCIGTVNYSDRDWSPVEARKQWLTPRSGQERCGWDRPRSASLVRMHRSHERRILESASVWSAALLRRF